MRRGLKIISMRRLEVLSLHRNLGVLIAPLLLVTTATGVFLSFPVSSRAMFDAFGAATVSAPPRIDGKDTDINWKEGLSEATAAFPSAAPRIVIWPRIDDPPSIRLRQPSEWHPNGRTVVAFEHETGRPIFIRDATNAGAGREAFNAIYPVHAASIGGRVYDVVMFLAGFGMFCLGGLGAFAFAKRLSR